MIISFSESILLLELEANYTTEVLKRQYRIMAHRYHPDKGGDAEKFKKIVAAYEFLKDHKLTPVDDHKSRVTVHNHYGGFTITYRF